MDHGESRLRPGRPAPARCLWWAHVAALVLVAAYVALSLVQSTPDANIGLGLGLLALSAMGLPWTQAVLSRDGVTTDSAPFVVAAVGGALLNLLLHALVRWARRRRSRAPRRG